MADTGIALGPSDGTHLRQAPVLDALGFASLWISGGQLDRLDRVDELLAATTTARIATGIVPFGPYGPADVLDLVRRVGTRRFVAGFKDIEGVRRAGESAPDSEEYSKE